MIILCVNNDDFKFTFSYKTNENFSGISAHILFSPAQKFVIFMKKYVEFIYVNPEFIQIC